MNLSGHTILITGGSAGIGLAFARKFVDLGNDVIVTGRRQAKLDEVKAANPKIHVIQSDVTDAKAIAALAVQVKQQFPRLDVLMNNAGIMLMKNLRAPSANLETLPEELNVNLAGPIRMTSAFIDLITANKGTIINVSSGLAVVPLTSAPIYCATKAALHSYTISLRFQLQEAGVRVVELLPPATKTDLADFPEGGGITVITTDTLVNATVAALKAGDLEICVGQSKQLRFMSRVAPGFINEQLFKGSKSIIPPPESAKPS